MKKLLVGLAFAAVAGTAQAQNYMPMQQDQMLLRAINDMASIFASGCQMNNQIGCQGYQYIMANAGAMSQANDACQRGNQQACQYYGMYYAQMEQDYAAYQRQMANAGNQYGSGANPLGNTHADRMQAIQNFGAQNGVNYQNRINQMDQNHAAWMRSQGY